MRLIITSNIERDLKTMTSPLKEAHKMDLCVLRVYAFQWPARYQIVPQSRCIL